MQTRRLPALHTRATERQFLRALAPCLFQPTRIRARARVDVMVLVRVARRMWILIVHVLPHTRRPRTTRRRRDTMQIRSASRTATTLVITTEVVVAGAGDTAFQEAVVGMVVREVQEAGGYIIRAWRARRCGDPR